MVDMSKAQDVEAGDGTTSSVIAAGSLLNAVKILLNRGIHATTIGDAFLKAQVCTRLLVCSHTSLPCAASIISPPVHLQRKSVEILEGMADKVELSDDKTLIEAATTSLSSKVLHMTLHLMLRYVYPRCNAAQSNNKPVTR